MAASAVMVAPVDLPGNNRGKSISTIKKARTDVQGNSSREKALECHESKKKPAADASKSRGLEIGEGVEDEKSKSGTLAAKQPGWIRKASRRKKINLPAAVPRAERPSYDQEVIDLTGDP